MLNTLRSQKALIAENIKGEEQRTGSERERLTALIRGLESGDRSTSGSNRTANGAPEGGGERHGRGQSAEIQGVHDRGRFQAAPDLVLEQKQAISALNQQLTARRNQLTETQFSLRQLPTVMAQKVQALRNDLAAAEQRIAEINGRRAYVIRAPTAGRISTLQATVGQNADPQRLQLEIIPEHAVLQAELLVPARAIGFVEAGQPVRILYDAFPYQHFGTYSGPCRQGLADPADGLRRRGSRSPSRSQPTGSPPPSTERTSTPTARRSRSSPTCFSKPTSSWRSAH